MANKIEIMFRFSLVLSVVSLVATTKDVVHFDLTLKVTDKTRFGEDNTDTTGKVKDGIAASLEGVDSSMVSLWKVAAPTPADSGDDNSTSATAAPSVSPSAAPVSSDFDNRTSSTLSPAGDDDDNSTSPSPASAGDDDDDDSTDDNSTDDNSTDANSSRRLADEHEGDVKIPVYVSGAPDSVKLDAKTLRGKEATMMEKINTELGAKLVTAVAVSMGGSDANSAWLLQPVLTVLALLALDSL